MLPVGHNPDQNSITYIAENNGSIETILAIGPKRDGSQLAWQEGWANYFSVSAQVHQNAGDLGLYEVGDASFAGYYIEGIGHVSSKGEGHELAVARALWDMADVNNDTTGATDNDPINWGFFKVWNYSVDSESKTFSDFMQYVYGKVSKTSTTYQNVGSILESQKICGYLTSLVYYLTRLGIDASDFLLDIVRDSPVHPIMRLTIAYGCVLSENPTLRTFALDYARSISTDSVDAVTNRAWTIIYFGDVDDRDPYEYADDEKRPWHNARLARIRRFTKENPRLKDYRFRLFDIPLFHSFLRDRNWNEISQEEYAVLSGVGFPEDKFTQEERQFLTQEKEKLLEAYRKELEKSGFCSK